MNSQKSLLTKVHNRARPAHAPKLREAVFEDYGRIARLGGSHGLPPEPFDRWTSLWLRNPAYSRDIPIGWVLEDGGEIVGFLGNIPLHYELNGDLVRTVSPRSWVVDEAYRGYTLLLADALLQQSNIDLILSALGKGSPAFAAMGAKPVPQRVRPESCFWITEPAGFSRAYLCAKQVHRATWFLQRALVTAVTAKQLWNSLHRRHGTFRAERCVRFDERFNRFWVELRNRKRDILLGRRDTTTLEWHFGPALQEGAGMLFVVAREQQIQAYGIFLRADNPFHGLRRMLLVDYQGPDQSQSSFASILDAALIHCRREAVHMVEVGGSRLQQSAALQSAAAFRREVPPVAVYLYKATDHIERSLSDESRWDLTAFDGDSSLSDSMNTR